MTRLPHYQFQDRKGWIVSDSSLSDLQYQHVDTAFLLLYSRRFRGFRTRSPGRGGVMTRVLGRLWVATLLVLLTFTTAWAQGGATAQISGTVKDASGGVLTGADVTITQTDTGLKRNTVTDANGAFSFPNIPVGPHRLDVMLQGFRSFAQTGIVLQVNDSPVVAVLLQLGQVAETITVQGNTTMIETRNMGVG